MSKFVERRLLAIGEAGAVEVVVGDRTMQMCMACAVNEHEQHDMTVCTDCGVCRSLEQSEIAT